MQYRAVRVEVRDPALAELDDVQRSVRRRGDPGERAERRDHARAGRRRRRHAGRRAGRRRGGRRADRCGRCRARDQQDRTERGADHPRGAPLASALRKPDTSAAFSFTASPYNPMRSRVRP